MEQERWRRVEALYHSALERPPEDRIAFLTEACSDPELRQEVEALLGQPGEGMLDHPIAEARFPRSIIPTSARCMTSGRITW
jgi:hypothetical protein